MEEQPPAHQIRKGRGANPNLLGPGAGRGRAVAVWGRDTDVCRSREHWLFAGQEEQHPSAAGLVLGTKPSTEPSPTSAAELQTGLAGATAGKAKQHMAPSACSCGCSAQHALPCVPWGFSSFKGFIALIRSLAEAILKPLQDESFGSL